jgi:CBS domain-containing protein
MNLILFPILWLLFESPVQCFTSTSPSRLILQRGSFRLSATSLTPVTVNLRSTDPISRLLQNSKYATVFSNASIANALAAMESTRRSSVVIIDEQNYVKGLFTERDFVNRVFDKNLNLTVTPIAEAMTKHDSLYMVHTTESIQSSRDLMLKNKVRHLPVLDDNKKCVGVVSLTELIRSIQRETIQLESASFFGKNVEDVELQVQSRANELALAPENKGQDLLRSGYVVAGWLISVALLQAGWVRDHEYISMVSIA